MENLRIVKYILAILLLVVLISSCLNYNSYAYDWTGTLGDLDAQEGVSELNNPTTQMVGAIIDVVRIVATGVAIIMIIVVAMKYMMSAPGDRADIKKHATVYIVGAIVLFASSAILTIIQDFASNLG